MAKKIMIMVLATLFIGTFVLFQKESEYAIEKIKKGDVILECSGKRKPSEIKSVVIGDNGYWYIISFDGTEDVCHVY